MITSKSRSTFSDHKDFKTLFNSTEMGQFKDEVYGILDCNTIHISINSKILIKGKIEDLIHCASFAALRSFVSHAKLYQRMS